MEKEPTSKKEQQTFPNLTDHVLMIRPSNFGLNAETASDNVF